MKKLKSFNAWGTVSVSNNTITVLLSAITEDMRSIDRTLKGESKINIGHNGSALIAINIEPKAFTAQAHEIGETPIAEHPQVKKAITDAVEWIRKSV